MMRPRLEAERRLTGLVKQFPAVALLGPRQCGKTTLAKTFAKKFRGPVHLFDLEDYVDLARLDNPRLALSELTGLVVIDEIQRRPEIFPVLRVLIDSGIPAKFLLLGSASRDLLAQTSETLAGRIGHLELGGFNLDETSARERERLWVRGGFPLSFLAPNENESLVWRTNFISTFLERDIPNLGLKIPAQTLRRFWMMLSHYHGQLFNASEIGKSLGLSDKTMRHYLDILTDTFMIRQLHPWHSNGKKRLIKSPKIFFRDSGIFHALMSIPDEKALRIHPKIGASWEGFAIEQTVRHFKLESTESFFWGVHGGAELDLIFFKNGKAWGAEIKYTDAPKLTPSMLSALNELNLAHLWVLYPGSKSYALHEKVLTVPLSQLTTIRL